MKKYLCLGLVLLTMSCSSDHKNEDEPQPIPKPTTQYEVDLTLTRAQIDQFPTGAGTTRLVVFEKESNKPLGNLGLMMYSTNVNYRDYIVYDLCCPYHWEGDKKHSLTIEKSTNGKTYASCDLNNNYFDLEDGKARTIGEREKIDLVRYQVERTPKEHIYPEESIHISNPKFEK